MLSKSDDYSALRLAPGGRHRFWITVLPPCLWKFIIYCSPILLVNQRLSFSRLFGMLWVENKHTVTTCSVLPLLASKSLEENGIKKKHVFIYVTFIWRLVYLEDRYKAHTKSQYDFLLVLGYWHFSSHLFSEKLGKSVSDMGNMNERDPGLIISVIAGPELVQ